MDKPKRINRRSFLGQAGAAAIGARALRSTAFSYGRILGANDRISLGHIGVGRRVTELDDIVSRLVTKHVEMTAVFDLWKMKREAAVWTYRGPRWRGREEVSRCREQDPDWRRWLLTKPYRPFDPRMYFEFRLYKDFSSGIPDQWMSHGIDLVHYFLDVHFPRSVVASGGGFAWKDGRENPDTFQALLEYPKFLVSYSTSFGNDSDSFTRIMGKAATLVNIGGEGSPRWKWVEEKGTHEDDPNVKRAEKYITLSGDDRIPPPGIGDDDLSHMTNWLECLR